MDVTKLETPSSESKKKSGQKYIMYLCGIPSHTNSFGNDKADI